MNAFLLVLYLEMNPLGQRAVWTCSGKLPLQLLGVESIIFLFIYNNI